MRLEKMSKSEKKINMKLVYTLMAIFATYLKPNSQVLYTLCEVAEEVTGEPFSIEVLEETIEKISMEDKIEVAKIVQKFLSTIKGDFFRGLALVL